MTKGRRSKQHQGGGGVPAGLGQAAADARTRERRREGGGPTGGAAAAATRPHEEGSPLMEDYGTMGTSPPLSSGEEEGKRQLQHQRHPYSTKQPQQGGPPLPTSSLAGGSYQHQQQAQQQPLQPEAIAPPPLQVPPGMIGESAELLEEAGLYDVDAFNRRLAASGGGGGGGGGAGEEAGPGGQPPPPSSIPRVVVCPSTFGSNSGDSDISPLTSKTGGQASWARQMTMLVLISVLPFGGHFVKNCLTSLEVYLIEDPRLHLSETRYGLLLSMTSLPNFFIPFLGGVFLDKRGHRFATLLFLFLVLIGQIIFTIAIQLGDFQLAMIGRVVLGLGEGSVVVAQRAVISHVFKAKAQVTFAVGVSVAMACLSKTLSRATVVPAANFLGGYIGGLWYTCVVCLLSTLAGVVFIILSDEREDPFERRRNKSVSMSYADSFLGSPLDGPHHAQHAHAQHAHTHSGSGAVSVNTKCVR